MIKYKCPICNKIEFYEYSIYDSRGKVPICIHGERVYLMVKDYENN